jgi:hypothetical protein
MALAIVITLAALGGIAVWRGGDALHRDDRVAWFEGRRCMAAYPPEEVPPAVRERCQAPYRAHIQRAERESLSYLLAAMPFALMCVAGFWLAFAIAFFGIRHLRGGKDETELEA